MNQKQVAALITGIVITHYAMLVADSMPSKRQEDRKKLNTKIQGNIEVKVEGSLYKTEQNIL